MFGKKKKHGEYTMTKPFNPKKIPEYKLDYEGLFEYVRKKDVRSVTYEEIEPFLTIYDKKAFDKYRRKIFKKFKE